MELIRNTHDIMERKILNEEKIHELALQKHKMEIERLMKLDNHNQKPLDN